jgi:GST-like protein
MDNRIMGDTASQLHERHDAGDFGTRTQDKLEAAAAESQTRSRAA